MRERDGGRGGRTYLCGLHLNRLVEHLLKVRLGREVVLGACAHGYREAGDEGLHRFPIARLTQDIRLRTSHILLGVRYIFLFCVRVYHHLLLAFWHVYVRLVLGEDGDA